MKKEKVLLLFLVFDINVFICGGGVGGEEDV